MKDIEDLIKNADFAAGSDHKSRLHDELFSGTDGRKDNVVVGQFLSDDELDLASAGAGATGSGGGKVKCPDCGNMTVTMHMGSWGVCSKCGFRGML